MTSSGKVTDDGRLDVPADVLDALRVGPGDAVHFRVENGRALLEKTTDVRALAGAVEVPPDKRGLSWEEIRREARAAWVAESS